MPTISKRAKAMPSTPIRKLAKLASDAKESGKKVYHLNIGQPDIMTPNHALEAVKAVEKKVIEYSPTEGYLSFRQKMTEYYNRLGITVYPDNIFTTTGASEAIQLVLQICLDHHESLILPEPFYANYNGFVHIAETIIQPISCRIEDGFKLPPIEEIEAVITPDTKCIFLTNPNNPTGCFYSQSDLEKLAVIVKNNDLFLVVDEVYREFCYDDNLFYSALQLADLDDNVIVIDSISKRYSACGARIGAVLTRNKKVLENVMKYANLRLSPPSFGQILGEALMDTDHQYMEKVKEEYDLRRKTIYNRLQAMPGVVSYLPGGAFYCFARFPIADAEHFCRWLLEEFEYQGATVMLSPGQGFYATPGLGQDEVRIAYVLNTNDLNAAMDCLEKALEVYPGRVSVDRVALVGVE